MKNTAKITAIIPTLNEEVFIREAIKSVDFADEIIVIDSFSSDATVEIARSLNVTVLQRKFDDFSSQKNFAISQASHTWIYVLDADERVSNDLREEIIARAENPLDCVGFYVYRNFYLAGKQLKYGGVRSDKVIRLFRKDYCKYNGQLVHERIVANGNVGFLKNRIAHYSYRSYNHHIHKLNRYAALQAKSLFDEGSSVNLYHILIKPPVRFIIHFFIKFGFLDGYRGVIIAALKSYGVLARYIKLWLLKKNLN